MDSGERAVQPLWMSGFSPRRRAERFHSQLMLVSPNVFQICLASPAPRDVVVLLFRLFKSHKAATSVERLFFYQGCKEAAPPVPNL